MNVSAAKLEWMAVKGNIRTKEDFRVKSDLGLAYRTPIWIAFNLSEEYADHIVRLHNSSLTIQN